MKAMPIANFIGVSPALCRMRSLSAELARTITNRQKRECTWCGGPVPRPRIYWCSDDCLDAFKGICRPASARFAAIMRLCVGEAIRYENGHDGKLYAWSGGYAVTCEGCGSVVSELQTQLDHIVPVSEGGGLCGPENYRLLCLDCHKVESAAGAKRRAAARKSVK